MKRVHLSAIIILLFVMGCSNSEKKETTGATVAEKKQLTAQHYYSGFPLAHDTYNTITTASDGRVYYCLSSQSIDIGGQYYVYDPKTDKIE
ncbi:hypothetical protein, partial [Mariniphaga sediminis]|uniref:hypothetical protein n=1 Tax=Mariniphaga sediminis TaxID=1628158 RepID=UPI00356A0827